MESIAKGSQAPDFTLTLDSGESFRLSDHAGAPVVLYFYPQDNTEGCTIENIEFSDLMPEFKTLGAKVIGILPDTVESHCAFRDKHGLGVPLGADTDRRVLQAYGMWGPKVTYGHHLVGVFRRSVLIGQDGKVAGVFAATRIKGHAAKVLAATQALVAAG